MPKVCEKIKAFDGETLFTRDTHGPEYPETQEGEKPAGVPLCQGNLGLGAGTPYRGAARFRPPLTSPAFGSVSLAEALRDGNGAAAWKKSCWWGCAPISASSPTPFCWKAFLPETWITVDAACCAGVTPESHRTALEAMRASSDPGGRGGMLRLRTGRDCDRIKRVLTVLN